MPAASFSTVRARPELLFASAVLLIIAVGIGLRLQHGLHGPIEGHHAFRQSHVASNIDYYLRDGLGIPGEMYAKNNRDRVFDFPLYQFLTVGLTEGSELDPVVAGRLVNLALFGALVAVLALLLRQQSVPAGVALLTLWLIAVSPLKIYYDRGLIPDNLAIFLAYASLLWFLESDRRGLRWDLFLGLAIAAGVLASLIKNPLYLPIVAALALHHRARLPWSRLVAPQFLVYLAIIAATVVVFRLYTNYENVGRWSLSVPSEWYYGTVAERLELASYQRIYAHLTEMLPSALLVFFPIGVIRALFDRRIPRLFLFLLIGHLISVMLFFRLHRIHDYYMLHTVFIVCFFVAVGLAFVIGLAARGAGRMTASGRAGLAVRAAAFTGLVVAGLVIAQTKLVAGPNWYWIRTGRFIAERTPEDAVLLFMLDRRRWDPQFLYYTGREGFMIGPGDLDDERVRQRLAAEFDRDRPLYAFIKASQLDRLDLDQSQQWEPVGERAEGRLYRAAPGTLGFGS